MTPFVLSLIYRSDDGGATLHHYDLQALAGARLDEIRRLLGDPHAEQVLTAEEVAEHNLVPRGAVVVFAEDGA